jgi:MinD-like ATPase involved in chromosome partitioning or flagellar assembly|tara:strand:+ start:1040 stop:1417 length:378 start_codon:yes stop_codon:yes gene_type:complete
MEGNIIYFKLITGEHIVSFVDAADDEFVQLHKPLQLFVQNGIGGAAVRVAKWIPFVNASDVSIKANHVMVYAEPSDDIADYYLEAIETLARNEDEEKTDIEKEFIDEETTMALYEKFSNTSITVH